MHFTVSPNAPIQTTYYIICIASFDNLYSPSHGSKQQ